ncbi:MAG: hypothetical protein D6705_10780 [Deltaproteobacteria bacterium]|nr:MAG: hypothetical protein D6705_10780 [Deltaproteobacteria bacterium]
MTALVAAVPAASVAPVASWAVVAALGLVALYFVVRFDVFALLAFERIDPRPAALYRIVFGLVVLWAMVDLLPWAEILMTDEGIYLPSRARRSFGGRLDELWDPEHGFEGPLAALRALATRGSILHLRADPPFVHAVFVAAIAALVAMIVGYRTRVATLLAWWLVEQIYRYDPIYYNGGDIVVRIFLFLGVFTDWGRAYSLDAWRNRRRAIAEGDGRIPPLRRIPAWPLRLAMLQLAIIYTATGWLKMGETWWNGTALYYALSLDHFVRWPMSSLAAWGQRTGVLWVATHLVHAWEMLFPLAVVGAIVRGYLRHRDAGTWPHAGPARRWAGHLAACTACGLAGFAGGHAVAAYLPPHVRRAAAVSWTEAAVLGPVLAAVGVAAYAAFVALCLRAPGRARTLARTALGLGPWLGFGFLMHLGIDLLMNVGIFAEVMIATYLAWLSGRHVDRWWRIVGTRRSPPPPDVGPWHALLSLPVRLARRVPRPSYVVAHAPDERAVRRATLLRPWDLAGRLRFDEAPDLAAGAVELRDPSGKPLSVASAGAALARILPGLWPWVLVAWIGPVGRFVARRFLDADVRGA